MLVLDFKGGSVEDLIKTGTYTGLDSSSCSQYLEDVLFALCFLHGKGLLHNDVKGE